MNHQRAPQPAAPSPEAPGPYDPDPQPKPATASRKTVRKSVLHVLTLPEMLNYEPPPGSLLVGDGVIEAGSSALLFGPPGSFKGFAVGHLMACGARGSGSWLGFPINCRFASLWINCENGRRRLKTQFQAMDLPADAKDYIFSTDIPDVWSISDPAFSEELRETVTAHNIKLVIVDTVSNFTADELAKDFAAFFAGMNTIVQSIPWRVAVLLVHHARKPKDGDRSARGLLHTISGHQTLQRRSRCILYMGRVTEELTEKRVVSVCLKCSDSGVEEGKKMAVSLNDRSELEEIPDFDWSEWAAGTTGSKSAAAVTLEHLRTIFQNGEKWLKRAEAVEELETLAGVGRTSGFKYLKADGPYGQWLRENPINKKLSFRAEQEIGKE